MDDPRPILEYSSPAQEQPLDWWTEEQIHRDAVEAQNRAGFGDRDPFSSTRWMIAIVAVVAIAAFFLYWH